MKKTLALALLLAGCSTQSGNINAAKAVSTPMQSVTVSGYNLVLRGCSLYDATGKEVLLYHFSDEDSCFLMKHDGKARIFDTQHGKVVPMGLSGSIEDQCETKALAIVLKNGAFHLSRRFYTRFQCKGFLWPEKPFHVLATDLVELPAKNIPFEVNH